MGKSDHTGNPPPQENRLARGNSGSRGKVMTTAHSLIRISRGEKIVLTVGQLFDFQGRDSHQVRSFEGCTYLDEDGCSSAVH